MLTWLVSGDIGFKFSHDFLSSGASTAKFSSMTIFIGNLGMILLEENTPILPLTDLSHLFDSL